MENVKKENPLLTKSFDFSVAIVDLCFNIQNEKSEFVLTKQLLRSGTAIGALAEEAQQAESKADFVHKLSIANKEAHETHYWLRLMKASRHFPFKGIDPLLKDCEELKRLLISIIKSSKSH